MSDIRVAIIGCGYVADFYMATAANHTNVKVVRAYDIVPAHADRFSSYWKVPAVHEIEAFFDGLEADVILNLTNPDSHYGVSVECLNRGYSVYSEKPLAMKYSEIEELQELAVKKNLALGSAPCNHLSEALAGVRTSLERGDVGSPLLVYAEMDDGFIARSPYRNWINPSGAPWPYEDEFVVGCTLEHAGYYLTWLIALFGSITQVDAFSSLRYPGKPVGDGVEAPDFSVACLTFESGLVARLTCGVVAPRDHAFKVFGEEGVLNAGDCWFYDTEVSYRRWLRVRRRFMLDPFTQKVSLTKPPVEIAKTGAAAMDFIRGPIELVMAERESRTSRLPMDFCVHMNEVSLAIHESREKRMTYAVSSRCGSLPPVAIPAEPNSGKKSLFERHLAPVLGRL